MGVELDTSLAQSVAANANAMMAAVRSLGVAVAKHDFPSIEAHMQFCANDICGLMAEVRPCADALEADVPDELWSLPKYHEMLFIR